MRPRTGAAAALISLALVAGCSSPGHNTPPATTSLAPFPLVPGPAEAYTGLEIQAGSRVAAVPPAQRLVLAKLLVARVIAPAGPLPTYGLEPPQATLQFRRADGTTVAVSIGNPTFDRHGFYARRDQGPVLLLLGDELRAPLASVGIVVGPPT